MLGHTALLYLTRALPNWEVYGTVRRADTPKWISNAGLPVERILLRIDAANTASVESTIRSVRADVVLNCIGIVKQLKEGKMAIPSIRVNALFPHELRSICEAQGTRLIHISTDCVFSGKKGAYTESDEPDAVDIYGTTKRLGEVIGPRTLTIRTSIIGPEIRSSTGLFEWLMSQEGFIDGYVKAFFSGLTTIELSRVIAGLIEDQPDLHGLFHVSAERISKFELLKIIARVYEIVNLKIRRNDAIRIDRSLDSTQFQRETGYSPPEWDKMIEDMRGFQVEWKVVYGK